MSKSFCFSLVKCCFCTFVHTVFTCMILFENISGFKLLLIILDHLIKAQELITVITNSDLFFSTRRIKISWYCRWTQLVSDQNVWLQAEFLLVYLRDIKDKVIQWQQESCFSQRRITLRLWDWLQRLLLPPREPIKYSPLWNLSQYSHKYISAQLKFRGRENPLDWRN